jgi:hypothetical protein
VPTTSFERAFSAINLVKHKMRNQMGDSLHDDCLVTFIEQDIFSKVKNDDIIETSVAVKQHYSKKKFI